MSEGKRITPVFDYHKGRKELFRPLKLYERFSKDIQNVIALGVAEQATQNYNEEKGVPEVSSFLFSRKAQEVFEKFEVLEGSEIDMSRKCHSDNIEKQRQTAIQNGNIADIGGKYKLNVSVSFTSPSSAAMFVLGGSTNGWVEWKNKNGKTLDELFRK